MKSKSSHVSKRMAHSSSGDFNIKPLADRVILKEIDEKESVTAGGIFIPDIVENDKGGKKGKVIAVGEGRYEEGKIIPVKVSVGDTVLFQWGDKIKISDQEYFIVKENEIMAIIK